MHFTVTRIGHKKKCYDCQESFDYEYYKNEFAFWIKRNCFWSSGEWNYKDIAPKIICEKILEQPGKDCLDDYKLMCFVGKARLVFRKRESTWRAVAIIEFCQELYDREYRLLEGVRVTKRISRQSSCQDR